MARWALPSRPCVVAAPSGRKRWQRYDTHTVVAPVGVAAGRSDEGHERGCAGPLEVDRCHGGEQRFGTPFVEMNNEKIAADRRYIAAGSVTALLDDPDRLPSLPAAPRT